MRVIDDSETDHAVAIPLPSNPNSIVNSIGSSNHNSVPNASIDMTEEEQEEERRNKIDNVKINAVPTAILVTKEAQGQAQAQAQAQAQTQTAQYGNFGVMSLSESTSNDYTLQLLNVSTSTTNGNNVNQGTLVANISQTPTSLSGNSSLVTPLPANNNIVVNPADNNESHVNTMSETNTNTSGNISLTPSTALASNTLTLSNIGSMFDSMILAIPEDMNLTDNETEVQTRNRVPFLKSASGNVTYGGNTPRSPILESTHKRKTFGNMFQSESSGNNGMSLNYHLLGNGLHNDIGNTPRRRDSGLVPMNKPLIVDNVSNKSVKNSISTGSKSRKHRKQSPNSRRDNMRDNTTVNSSSMEHIQNNVNVSSARSSPLFKLSPIMNQMNGMAMNEMNPVNHIRGIDESMNEINYKRPFITDGKSNTSINIGAVGGNGSGSGSGNGATTPNQANQSHQSLVSATSINSKHSAAPSHTSSRPKLSNMASQTIISMTNSSVNDDSNGIDDWDEESIKWVQQCVMKQNEMSMTQEDTLIDLPDDDDDDMNPLKHKMDHDLYGDCSDSQNLTENEMPMPGIPEKKSSPSATGINTGTIDSSNNSNNNNTFKNENGKEKVGDKRRASETPDDIGYHAGGNTEIKKNNYKTTYDMDDYNQESSSNEGYDSSHHGSHSYDRSGRTSRAAMLGLTMTSNHSSENSDDDKDNNMNNMNNNNNSNNKSNNVFQRSASIRDILINNANNHHNQFGAGFERSRGHGSGFGYGNGPQSARFAGSRPRINSGFGTGFGGFGHGHNHGFGSTNNHSHGFGVSHGAHHHPYSLHGSGFGHGMIAQSQTKPTDDTIAVTNLNRRRNRRVTPNSIDSVKVGTNLYGNDMDGNGNENGNGNGNGNGNNSDERDSDEDLAIEFSNSPQTNVMDDVTFGATVTNINYNNNNNNNDNDNSLGDNIEININPKKEKLKRQKSKRKKKRKTKKKKKRKNSKNKHKTPKKHKNHPNTFDGTMGSVSKKKRTKEKEKDNEDKDEIENENENENENSKSGRGTVDSINEIEEEEIIELSTDVTRSSETKTESSKNNNSSNGNNNKNKEKYGNDKSIEDRSRLRVYPRSMGFISDNERNSDNSHNSQNSYNSYNSNYNSPNTGDENDDVNQLQKAVRLDLSRSRSANNNSSGGTHGHRSSSRGGSRGSRSGRGGNRYSTPRRRRIPRPNMIDRLQNEKDRIQSILQDSEY